MSYKLNSNNGFSQTNTSGSFIVSNPDVYELIVTDIYNGCESSEITTITTSEAFPSINLMGDPRITCINASVQMNTNFNSDYSYEWFNTNDLNTSLGSNNVSPLISTIGTYRLEVTNDLNSCVAVSTFDIIDDTYFIKEKIRSFMSQKFPSENNLNLLHSTDDDIELAFYANMLNIPLDKIIDDQLIISGSVDDTIN